MANPHIKSKDTTVPVAKSQADLLQMIARYGGTGFGYDHDDSGKLVVSFSYPKNLGSSEPEVNGKPRELLRVRMPIDVDLVRRRLNTPAVMEARRQQKLSTEVPREQAERVAWRNLYVWIDAALSAVSIGAQTPEEAFHAHLLVTSTSGHVGRIADYMTVLRGAIGDGTLPDLNDLARALPAAGKSSAK